MIVVHVQGRTGIHNHDKKSETNGLLETIVQGECTGRWMEDLGEDTIGNFVKMARRDSLIT